MLMLRPQLPTLVRLFLGLAIMASVNSRSPALAIELLAANNMDGGYMGSGAFHGVGYTNNATIANEAAGQRFVAGADGKLARIEVTVRRDRGGEPLIVSIHQAFPTVGGFVPGSRFGSLAFPENEVSDDVLSSLSSFDLSPLSIGLLAGADYIVTFKTSTALFQDLRYSALRTAPNINSFGSPSLFSSNGANWETSTSPEIGLRVYVEAVPEPSSLWLALGAAVAAAKARNFRLTRPSISNAASRQRLLEPFHVGGV